MASDGGIFVEGTTRTPFLRSGYHPGGSWDFRLQGASSTSATGELNSIGGDLRGTWFGDRGKSADNPGALAALQRGLRADGGRNGGGGARDRGRFWRFSSFRCSASWLLASRATHTPTPGELSAISCVTTSDCPAVESGEVVVTTNGGTNWTTETAPAGIGQIYAISCPSTTTCTVVGNGAQSNLPVIAATTNGGMSWTDQSLPPGLVQLTGISCPSTTACSAVGAWSGAAAPSAEEDRRGRHDDERRSELDGREHPRRLRRGLGDLMSLDDDLRGCGRWTIPVE